MSRRIDYQGELLKSCTMEDITGMAGLVQKIIKDAVEQSLGTELDEYISIEKDNGYRIVRDVASRKPQNCIWKYRGQIQESVLNVKKNRIN